MLDKKLLFLILFVFPSLASAMPWDIDMYRQQSLRSNEVARSPVQGTVPRGFKPFTLNLEEADKNLKNPIERNFYSTWRGQRLWNANCSACHGMTGLGDGSVGTKMGVPSLLQDFYKARSDGRIFATVFHGGANMPRYGYKFSHEEIWNLVIYLRYLQGFFTVPEISNQQK